MIYSGSSYACLEFRIQPITFEHIWKKKKIKFNQKEESTNFLPFSISYCCTSYNTHSPEFAGLKFEIQFSFICSFIFGWIRIRNTGFIGTGTYLQHVFILTGPRIKFLFIRPCLDLGFNFVMGGNGGGGDEKCHDKQLPAFLVSVYLWLLEWLDDIAFSLSRRIIFCWKSETVNSHG